MDSSAAADWPTAGGGQCGRRGNGGDIERALRRHLDQPAICRTDYEQLDADTNPPPDYVSDWCVFRMLDSLSPTATGLDGLPAWILRVAAPILYKARSGVAGPLSARGGGQICRPFVMCIRYRPRHKIGVIPTKSNRVTGRSQRPNVIAQDTEDRYALQL